MQYKAYNKRAVAMAARRLRGDAGTASPASTNTSFWQPDKWLSWWSSGAKQLDQTPVGSIITAPIELPAAALTATKQTVQEVPGVVKSTANALPYIAGAIGILGVAFIVYKVARK